MSEDPPTLPNPVPTNHGRFEGPGSPEDYAKAQKMDPGQIAQLKFQERAAVDALASRKHDKLTGFLRGDDFKEEVAQKLVLLGSSEQIDQPNVALIVQADVKGLKSVNDGEGGHGAGNDVLKNVADLLINVSELFKNVVRLQRGDLAGRLGGDEFGLALFFNTGSINPEEMQALFNERLMDKVHAEVTAGKITGLKWNSTLSAPGKKIDELLHEADPVEELHPGQVLEYPPKEVLPSR